jgi:hypothetical protein
MSPLLSLDGPTIGDSKRRKHDLDQNLTLFVKLSMAAGFSGRDVAIAVVLPGVGRGGRGSGFAVFRRCVAKGAADFKAYL